MRKGIISLVSLILLLASSYTSTAQNKTSADKIIAVVGNSIVLYSELNEGMNMLKEQQIREGYTPDRDIKSEAFEMLLMQKLMANQAQLDSLPVDNQRISSEIDNRINMMLQQFGSLSAIEKMIGKPIFQYKDDLRRRYEEMMGAQSMQQKVRMGVTITPTEVERFFATMSKDSLPIIPEQYTYAQVVVYPPSMAEAKLRTREKALELRERIINGDRFDVLARMYSVDKSSAIRGGELEFTPLEGYVKPFSEALGKLTVNQVSGVVETEFGFHLIQLLEKKGNLYRARHILLKPDFTSIEMQASLEQLDSIAKLIRVDSLKFEDAAFKHSEDKYSRLNKGVVTNQEALEVMTGQASPKSTSTKFLKEELMEDYKTISTLKIGELSMPYASLDLKGNQTTKIIKLINIVPPHYANLKDDYVRIEELALNNKTQQIFDEWLTKKIAAMYVSIDPEFRDADFKYKGWLK